MRWKYLENKKVFLIFFLHFWSLVQNLNIFKRKTTLIAEVFPKLRSPKNKVRSKSKKSRSKRSFEKQHGKRDQALFKFSWQYLCHIYWSLWTQLTCKKTARMTGKISRLFSNTLGADGKYSLLNRDNLTQSIQMQLSRKQKTFSDFFLHFWNLA